MLDELRGAYLCNRVRRIYGIDACYICSFRFDNTETDISRKKMISRFSTALLLLLFLHGMADSTAMTSSVPHRPKTLVTFDIDGTICVSDPKKSASANAMHTKAFSHAFREIYGIDASIDEVPHHGSTDQLILLKGDKSRPYMCNMLYHICAICFVVVVEYILLKFAEQF